MFSQAKGNLSALLSGKEHCTCAYLHCGTNVKITRLSLFDYKLEWICQTVPHLKECFQKNVFHSKLVID